MATIARSQSGPGHALPMFSIFLKPRRRMMIGCAMRLNKTEHGCVVK